MTEERRCKGIVRNGERTGEQCRNAALIGRDYCRYHGGRIPMGRGNGAFKNGRWSKQLPTRLAAQAEDYANDDVLFSLRSEVVLNDALLGDAIRRLDTGETEGLWSRLGKIEADLRRYRDDPEFTERLTELGRLIRTGASWTEANAEVGRLIDRRVRLVESERKRAMELQTHITLSQFSVFLAALSEVLESNVGNVGVIANIYRDLNRLTRSAAVGDVPMGAEKGSDGSGKAH